MSRFTRKSSKKAGSSPGTLVHVGEKKTDDIRLAMLHYDADTLMERPLNRVEEVLPLLTTATTTWINMTAFTTSPSWSISAGISAFIR